MAATGPGTDDGDTLLMAANDGWQATEEPEPTIQDVVSELRKIGAKMGTFTEQAANVYRLQERTEKLLTGVKTRRRVTIALFALAAIAIALLVVGQVQNRERASMERKDVTRLETQLQTNCYANNQAKRQQGALLDSILTMDRQQTGGLMTAQMRAISQYRKAIVIVDCSKYRR